MKKDEDFIFQDSSHIEVNLTLSEPDVAILNNGEQSIKGKWTIMYD